MFTRRQFLKDTLKTSSLIALAPMVPGFLAATARAAPGKDTVLVVVEMTGGNDGLNTVIPFNDDLYHKARPSLRLKKNQVLRLNDHVGLHPGMASLQQMFQKGELAVVQGVGYPNPNRSHFESMDVWQSGDPAGKVGNGWLGRGLGSVHVGEGQIPAIHVGADKLPLALQGSATAVPSIHPKKPYDLRLGGEPEENQGQGVPVPPAPLVEPAPPGGKPKPPPAEDKHRTARKKLIQDLAQATPEDDGLLQFVRRSSLQTYTTIDRLREITKTDNSNRYAFYFGGEIQRRAGNLAQELDLVARLIQAKFGTRIFYVSIDGFDTHSDQHNVHQQLLTELANAIGNFFQLLQNTGDAKRVVLMTFSEFGRRVKENGSRGTDHGAASCQFVAGPSVKAGVVGDHPRLDKLDDGDLKFHTDFRRVFATLLDGWLGCPSRPILAAQFEPLALLKKA